MAVGLSFKEEPMVPSAYLTGKIAPPLPPTAPRPAPPPALPPSPQRGSPLRTSSQVVADSQTGGKEARLPEVPLSIET